MQLTIQKQVTETIEINFTEPVYLTVENSLFYRFTHTSDGDVFVIHINSNTYDDKAEVRCGSPYDHDFSALTNPSWKKTDKATFDAKLSEVLARINFTPAS